MILIGNASTSWPKKTRLGKFKCRKYLIRCSVIDAVRMWYGRLGNRYEREMAEYKKSGGGAGADDGEDD